MDNRPVKVRSFAEDVLPHLDSAYNLARWLVRNPEDAEDVVQDACLRALRYFDGFHGGDARAWLLKIVRNSSYQWLQKHRSRQPPTEFDEAIHSDPESGDPEALLLQYADHQLVEQAISALPSRFREALVLREMDGLSYKEISEVMDVPIGTVMSSLSRARKRLRQTLSEELAKPLRSDRRSDARQQMSPALPRLARQE